VQRKGEVREQWRSSRSIPQLVYQPEEAKEEEEEQKEEKKKKKKISKKQ
jgi:hypothetical protein